MKRVFSFLLFMGISGLLLSQPTNLTITEESLAAMDQIKTLKYRLIKKERIKGVMKEGEIQVKYQRNPFKVYIYIYSPKPGVEILYNQGENGNKAAINPNSFFLNILDPNLDPLGKALRKDEHHTILETGFEFTRLVLKALKKRADDEKNFNELCKYQGEITWANRVCYKMLLTYPAFAWEEYTVKSGETLIEIARSKNLNEYMILEKNKLSWYDNVREGQTILVPNIFAKKVILYVDKLLKLPVYQEVHDDTGLFAVYEYHGVIVNPTIAYEEFTKNYKDYQF